MTGANGGGQARPAAAERGQLRATPGRRGPALRADAARRGASPVAAGPAAVAAPADRQLLDRSTGLWKVGHPA